MVGVSKQDAHRCKWVADIGEAELDVCCDMWQPYADVVKERAPQAVLVFDKFHIVRHLIAAVDQVRRDEIREKRPAHNSPWWKSRGPRYAQLGRNGFGWTFWAGADPTNFVRRSGARNPLGDSHLRSSALSVVGEDQPAYLNSDPPDRRPPPSSPSDRRSLSRDPRDFHHGLLSNGSGRGLSVRGSGSGC